MWKPYIWDLTTRSGSTPATTAWFRVFLEVTPTGVSLAASPTVLWPCPWLGPPGRQTRQPWPYEGPGLWGRSPFATRGSECKGTWIHRSPDMALPVLPYGDLYSKTSTELAFGFGLAWFDFFVVFFFFFWLWRWVVNFFWPGMICIPWDFFLYRIGEVRLFTQGYFVRNKWKQITTQFWGTAWKCCWNLTLFYLHLVL